MTVEEAFEIVADEDTPHARRVRLAAHLQNGYRARGKSYTEIEEEFVRHGISADDYETLMEEAQEMEDAA